MKTIQIYNFNELSQEAKDYAINQCKDKFETDLDFYYDNCIEAIKEKGFFGNIKLQYSLSYCQGDGVSFSCEYFDTKRLNKIFENILGQRKQKTIDLIINNCYFNLVGNTGRYCYASSRDLEFRFDDNINAPNIEEVVGKVEDKLREMYLSLCEELIQNGYAEIEHQFSNEYISELLEANDYEFLEDGQLINAY
jgi:hypothetical protein